MASADAEAIDWSRVRGALVGASIHMQKHQPYARHFVARHAADLNRIPSAFFSVSRSAASAKPAEVKAAQAIADAFPSAHGWRPAIVTSVARTLAYTKYGFLTRFLMKTIARKEGAPTDTSRDYELTDWKQVDLLAEQVADLVRKGKAGKETAAA
jgi:menaquinone-dependent protoporphyrinogen oxidase